MSTQDKGKSPTKSNGYEYDCEAYEGTGEASIDKMFPGWRESAIPVGDNQNQAYPAA
ncbi:MAG: hypothetical protein HY777_01720 [Betaproteobacteria bacterium]|nr:hypothetical protein [Betaproteobacteria bacterium]